MFRVRLSPFEACSPLLGAEPDLRGTSPSLSVAADRSEGGTAPSSGFPEGSGTRCLCCPHPESWLQCDSAIQQSLVLSRSPRPLCPDQAEVPAMMLNAVTSQPDQEQRLSFWLSPMCSSPLAADGLTALRSHCKRSVPLINTDGIKPVLPFTPSRTTLAPVPSHRRQFYLGTPPERNQVFQGSKSAMKTLSHPILASQK